MADRADRPWPFGGYPPHQHRDRQRGGAKAIFQRDTPPLNLIGGYRFPGAPAIDLGPHSGRPGNPRPIRCRPIPAHSRFRGSCGGRSHEPSRRRRCAARAARARATICMRLSECATQALLEHERIAARVWEPAWAPAPLSGCCGKLRTTWSQPTWSTGAVPIPKPEFDFLFERRAPDGIGLIVTNPPFKLAPAFVAHALALVPHVVMLLRLGFLESESRRGTLDTGRLARVLIFRNRLPMMHRHGWSGPRASSATAYAWFVFDRNHHGPTELQRISWKAAP